MHEEWRAIKGWPYEVSNLGRVRRSAPAQRTSIGRLLSPSLTSRGYRQVHLFNKRAHVSRRVAPLVAEAFIGQRPMGRQINHINGVKTDDRGANLEWITPSENIRHAFRLGLSGSGERHHNAKLDSAQVMIIRRVRGVVRQRRLAGLFGVDRSTISAVQTGRNWTVDCIRVKDEVPAARKPQQREAGEE